MNDEPKPQSIWKKPLRGPIAWFLGWLVLMAAGFLMFFLFGPVLTASRWNTNEEMHLLLAFEAGATIFVLLIAFVWWLRRWQNLKRFLFVVACVATLVGLFYAEEDWRGRHAWLSYKHEWEAKGEHFEMKDIIPPPVPDDKNFAMTPIIVNMYSFILTKDGKHLPWEQRDTNYVSRTEFDLGDRSWDTNAIGYWAMGTLSRLDLWQQHYRDLATQTNEFAVPARPGSPGADVLLALSKYDPAVEEIRQASQLPECRFPLDYDNEDPAAILLPHLAALKRTSQLLQLRALAELENGQNDKAAADVLLTLRLADYIRDEPTYIGLLVRMVMVDIALQPVYEGLARHQWTDTQLKALGDALARIDYLEDFNHVLRWERSFSNGIIDYLAKRDTRRRYVELFGEYYEDDFSHQVRDDWGDLKAVGVSLMPSGWLDLNRLAIAQFDEQRMLHIADPEKHQIDTAATTAMTSQLDSWHGNVFNFMAKPFLGSFRKAPHRFAREQSTMDLARTAIALERYRLAQGTYPENLDALAPKFVNIVNTDVIGGQPLKYRLEASGQFVLYSVGWNGKDDGGVTGYSDGRTQVDFESGHTTGAGRPDFDYGDWVWRYPKM